jgi:hypothetical protein
MGSGEKGMGIAERDEFGRSGRMRGIIIQMPLRKSVAENNARINAVFLCIVGQPSRSGAFSPDKFIHFPAEESYQTIKIVSIQSQNDRPEWSHFPCFTLRQWHNFVLLS